MRFYPICQSFVDVGPLAYAFAHCNAGGRHDQGEHGPGKDARDHVFAWSAALPANLTCEKPAPPSVWDEEFWRETFLQRVRSAARSKWRQLAGYAVLSAIFSLFGAYIAAQALHGLNLIVLPPELAWDHRFMPRMWRQIGGLLAGLFFAVLFGLFTLFCAVVMIVKCVPARRPPPDPDYSRVGLVSQFCGREK